MPASNDRGSLTEAVYYILLSLYKPLHGYGIMQTVGEWSKGRVVLGAGTLYGALNTLVEKRWIEEVTDSKSTRKKEYIVTDEGKKQVREEMKRLEERLENGKRIVGDSL